MLRRCAALACLVLLLSACSAAPATVSRNLIAATPGGGSLPATTPAARQSASPTPSAISFNYRLELRRMWTTTGTPGHTTYFLDVAICNQTTRPQALRADALRIIVRPRGRPAAVGYSLQPQPTPDGGFTDAPLAEPGTCASGVVRLEVPQGEVPASLWYRRSGGADAAEPVGLPTQE